MRTPTPHPDQNRRRDFLGAALVGLASGSVLSSPAPAEGAEPESFSIKALFPAGAPAAAPGYSPGIVVQGRKVVLVSGQGPADVKAAMEAQIRETFDRIGAVLKAADASFKNVVMMRAYFVHLLRDLPIYRKVRTDYLREPYPASTAVGVTELAVAGLEVEIEAVAVL
jgi:enamine deaminase RidA (YjgF/YER057c/UK114 family)